MYQSSAKYLKTQGREYEKQQQRKDGPEGEEYTGIAHYFIVRKYK